MGFQDPNLAALPRHPIIIDNQCEERGSGPAIAHIYPGNGRVTRA